MMSHATDIHAALPEPILVRNMFVCLTPDQQREMIGIARGLTMGFIIPEPKMFSSSTLEQTAEKQSNDPTIP